MKLFMKFDGFKKLKEKLIHLFKLNNTPHEIAFGVGVGAFIAILPLYGLHTVMVVLAAMFIPKINRIAILIGTNVSLPPTLPFITWIGYSIGRFILGENYPKFHFEDFKHFNLQMFWNFYYPLFIGSVAEGLICGCMLYFLVKFVLKNRLKNNQRLSS